MDAAAEIEALDQPGASGNLIDLLLFFSEPDRRRAYERQQGFPWPPPLVPNQPIPVLMIFAFPLFVMIIVGLFLNLYRILF